MVEERFIDMCAVCKQGVTKTLMVYRNGRVFHERCFETKGSMFPPINQEIAQLTARARIDLVQMKNLKVRTDSGLLKIPKNTPKKNSKPAKSKTAKKRR